jgi:hypothetical protein
MSLFFENFINLQLQHVTYGVFDNGDTQPLVTNYFPE